MNQLRLLTLLVQYLPLSILKFKTVIPVIRPLFDMMLYLCTACIPSEHRSAITIKKRANTTCPVYHLSRSADKVDKDLKTPRTVKTSDTAKTIIFLHGGAFMTGGWLAYRNFAKRLVHHLQHDLYFIDYPLTPEHDFTTIFNQTYTTYQQLVAKNHEVVLMGDSAGAMLAMHLLQRLIKKQAPLPGKAVMISPWLDFSGSYYNEAQLQQDVLFRRLMPESKWVLSWLFPQGFPTDHALPALLQQPQLLKHIPPTLSVCSSTEVFRFEAQTLCQHIPDGKHLEYDNTWHDFILFDHAQTTRALDDIKRFLEVP